jgi:hypothetical protein
MTKKIAVLLGFVFMTGMTAAYSADLAMTADQLATAEKSNEARFNRDIVGKLVTTTGRVKSISSNNFHFEASDTMGGWLVYTKDKNLLADLDVGKQITVTCRVDTMSMIGGHSQCD